MRKSVYYIIRIGFSILIIVASNYAFIITDSLWRWAFAFLMGVGIAIMLRNEGMRARYQQMKKIAGEVETIVGKNKLVTCYYSETEQEWRIAYEDGSSEPLNDLFNRHT